MAEKTIKTRIKLKYDTYENWTTNNPILKQGEMAVTAILTGNTQTVNSVSIPQVLLKVGDGVTAYNSLPWASGLAADVYSWAKASTKPSYNYSEITGTPTIGNGKITIKQNNSEVGSFTVNQTGETTIELTDTVVTDTNTQYQLALTDHTLKLQKKDIGESGWTDVQTLTLPDKDTTYSFAEGTTNGAFTVTPSGGSATTIKVHGLKSAAYTESSDYATAAQGLKADNAVPNTRTVNGHALSSDVTITKSDVGLGSVENKSMDSTPTESSSNYVTSGGVKSYVDSAIDAVKQFKYEIVESLPEASASTMGTIYLVSHEHSVTGKDIYDEYITINSGSTYSWEKIGNTDIDLTEYVKTLSGTSTNGVITGLSKSGNTLTVTSTNLSTTSPTENGNSLAFIDTVSQSANGKITATKKNIPDMTGASASSNGSHGLVPAPKSGENTKFLKGDGSWSTPDNTTYTFAEGTTNGEFSVTPSNGSATSVKVHGLKNAAYKDVDTSISANTTSTNLPTSKAVEDRINSHSGIDKVGTVTNVGISTTTNGGLKVTNSPITSSGTINIDIDDSVTFVFDCGSSSTNI